MSDFNEISNYDKNISLFMSTSKIAWRIYVWPCKWRCIAFRKMHLYDLYDVDSESCMYKFTFYFSCKYKCMSFRNMCSLCHLQFDFWTANSHTFKTPKNWTMLKYLPLHAAFFISYSMLSISEKPDRTLTCVQLGSLATLCNSTGLMDPIPRVNNTTPSSLAWVACCTVSLKSFDCPSVITMPTLFALCLPPVTVMTL